MNYFQYWGVTMNELNLTAVFCLIAPYYVNPIKYVKLSASENV